MKRKEFVKTTALAAASLAIPGKNLFATTADPKVRMALIGTGLRGQEHLDLLLRRTDVTVIAICDVEKRMLDMANGIIAKSGKKMPQVYTGDAYAWKRMLEKE